MISQPPHIATMSGALSPGFVGSESDDDGFVGAGDRPARKRKRVVTRDDKFCVAVCTQAEAEGPVLWWGLVTVRWEIAFGDNPSNASAHRAANKRAVRPGGSFVDYCLQGAVWCDGLVAGLLETIPLEASVWGNLFVINLVRHAGRRHTQSPHPSASPNPQGDATPSYQPMLTFQRNIDKHDVQGRFVWIPIGCAYLFPNCSNRPRARVADHLAERGKWVPPPAPAARQV